MGLLSRILSPFVSKQTEGQYHPGPWALPVTGGWLPADVGRWMNWWQMGYDPVGGSTTAMVEACVSAYAQTIAMCPGTPWRSLTDGGREVMANSALMRIMRRPNDYQSISDFMLNLVRGLYLDGNAYALALRNSRFEISSLHLMNPRKCSPRVSYDGEIFYQLAGNDIIDARVDEALIVPARDVLHVRLHTPVHPLKGVSPLLAAALDVAASGAMTQQQVNFYLNQARPSFVLETDQILTKEQVADLRERWNAQAQGLNSGGTPILSAGLKANSIASNAQDSQLADVMKLTDQHVALVYLVPLAILGIGGTTYASTELLMQSWIASGLGFALNHVEESFGQLFELRGYPDEYLELDTRALLRSAHRDRIEALSKGVISGIYSPNEARAEEDLGAVEFGDEPRVQQQVVPLSAAGKIPASPPPPPPAPPADGTDPQGDGSNADKSADIARDILDAAAEFERAA